jgi:hypothetical protein
MKGSCGHDVFFHSKCHPDRSAWLVVRSGASSVLDTRLVPFSDISAAIMCWEGHSKCCFCGIPVAKSTEKVFCERCKVMECRDCDRAKYTHEVVRGNDKRTLVEMCETPSMSTRRGKRTAQ